MASNPPIRGTAAASSGSEQNRPPSDLTVENLAATLTADALGTTLCRSTHSGSSSSIPSVPSTHLGSVHDTPRNFVEENWIDSTFHDTTNQVVPLPAGRTQASPPTPFEDGTYSTIVKCAWCSRRSKFFYDRPDGGEEHKFRDWIEGRVVNRRQIICDACNARGIPPHGKFFARVCSEGNKTLWFIDEAMW